MSKKLFGAFLVGAALLVAGTSFAGDKAQTTCPITGKAIDKTKFADVQGQRVYFCCSSCPAKFKADPEKVFAKLAADGVVAENVQKSDPVCGMMVSTKSVRGDWKGRRLFFCSDSCKASFLKEPAKYLKALDEKPKS